MGTKIGKILLGGTSSEFVVCIVLLLVDSCNVDVPVDYTKKKNVLRLKTATETEYLLQAEDNTDMVQWMKCLQEQQQQPQENRPVKKVTNLRNRSPTGQSPASKTRKPSQQLTQQPGKHTDH